MNDHPLLSHCQHFVGHDQPLLSWQDLRRGRYASARTTLILLIDSAKVLPKSTTETINLSDEEIGTKLNNITSSHITYHKWETTQEQQKGKLVSCVNLIKKVSERQHFISELQESLPAFRAHCGHVQMQYNRIHHMKVTLRPGKDIGVQLDYAENWSATYLREISSAYYDKKMITVHPMVTRHRSEQGVLVAKSFVGVTDVLAHSFPMTFTFLKMLMKQIKEHTALEVVHFISDGPSSQYWNRFTCDMVAHFRILFGAEASWLEKGHGKGPCDGVGGAVKKLADNLIKTAKIIDSSERFYREVSQATDVMILLRTQEADMEASACEIKSWASVSVPGLMETHMIVGTEGYIWTKPTSCFHACCYTAPKFIPNCDGWKRSKMVFPQEIDEDDIPINELIRRNQLLPRMANITTEPTELTDIKTERAETLAVVYGEKWYVCQVE